MGATRSPCATCIFLTTSARTRCASSTRSCLPRLAGTRSEHPCSGMPVHRGFSTNPSTWLPINPNYKETNVANELRDPWSPLSRIKRVLAFRNDNPEIALGHTQYLPHPENFPPAIKDKVVATQFSTADSF